MDNFKCGNCQHISSAKEWDDNTLGICLNRSQRRLFRGVRVTTGKLNKYWYVCPVCHEKIMRSNITEEKGEQ